MNIKNRIPAFFNDCFFTLRILFLVCFFARIQISCIAQHPDIELLRRINLHRNTSLDPTFRFITNTATPVSFGAPIITYTIGLIENNAEIKNKGLYIGASILTASVFSTSLKVAVKRERPFITYPDIQKETKAGSESFPSGHTSTAFSAATSLTIAFPKWYVVVPSYLWASCVAYSRMDLGVHYPTDVLGGMISGAGSALLCHKANQWLQKRKIKKQITVE